MAGGCKQHQGIRTEYGAKYGDDDIIAVILNYGNKTIRFFKNNEDLGVAFDNLRGSVRVAVHMHEKRDAVKFMSVKCAMSE